MGIKNTFKKLIPLKVKKYFVNKKIQKKYSSEIHNKKNKKTVVLLASPLHPNCGDLAIIQAEKEFFKKYFPNYFVSEIFYDQLLQDFNNRVKSIKKSDLLILPGGGNMGDLWYGEEEIRIKLVKALPKNKFVSFPQSVYFSNTPDGNEKLKLSKTIYENHKNIFFFLRDKKSYDYFKNNFNCKCALVPDIVLSLNKNYLFNRNGIILCLRKDKEATLKKAVKERIEGFLTENGQSILYLDTLTQEQVTKYNTGEIVENKLKEFAKAKLVITDRLHGMIFSAITGTPCIAFNNSYGKVLAQYEWIKDLEYIKVCENFNDFKKNYSELNLEKKYIYNEKLLNESFKTIIKAIKNKNI